MPNRISPRSFNPLLLPDVVINSIRYANWKNASKNGPAGIAAETLETFTGANTEPFFVSQDSGWTADAIAALLIQYGVRIWGVGYLNNETFFRVKKRQAHWAQYVMLRAGIPLEHGMIDGSRAVPGYRRAREQQKDESGPLGKIVDWLAKLLG